MCPNIKKLFSQSWGKNTFNRNCTSFRHNCKNVDVSYLAAEAEDLDSIDLHMISLKLPNTVLKPIHSCGLLC